jgi:hypothetical protein
MNASQHGKFALLGILVVALQGCGGGGGSQESPIPLTVAKAFCGANDRPETALQGQVPAPLRTAGGFKGFNCNLQLIGQSRGEGAAWSVAKFGTCAYYGTINNAAQTNHGVVVLDVGNTSNPRPTTYLTTPAMLLPHESMRVNERRQVLGADHNAANEVDFYDVSGVCSSPQLLSSVALGNGDLPTPAFGHEGTFSPDGLTYWGGDIGHGQYYAVDITNLTNPRLLVRWQNPYSPNNGGAKTLTTHGLSISEDGNRAYFTSLTGLLGLTGTEVMPYAPGTSTNGVIIADTSEVQARKANPQVKVIGTLFWEDGTVAQHTIPIKIAGKSYLIGVDEGGSGGLPGLGTNNNLNALQNACNAKMSPFPMARIIDISDETKPKVISKLMLETHDPANCDKVLPDLVGRRDLFTYGSHYCGVDDRLDATVLACGYMESGIRVFDIRDPLRPKEIAYFVPPSVVGPSAGSSNANSGDGKPDHCPMQMNFDKSTGSLWTACQDNGFLALKFTNGVWPFK